MVRLLAGGGAAGLGTVAAELIAHGYSGYTVIAVIGLLVLSLAGSAAVRLCETRAKRSPAQVKAAAVTRAARRMADPERALRLLLGAPADQPGTSVRRLRTPRRARRSGRRTGSHQETYPSATGNRASRRGPCR